MLTVDLSQARPFLNDAEVDKARNEAERAFQRLREGSGVGTEWLGWRRMLADPNDAVLEQIDDTAARIRNQADIFIVCGIGGSYLGARGVVEALSPFFDLDGGPEIIYAGHHMSGRYLQQLLKYLDRPGPDGEPKQVYLNVISKSGSTLETALAFRVLRDFLHQRYEDAGERIICTTGESGGVLNKLIDEHGYRKFIIPEDVGGRFSVLTPVGMLPVAVAGIDIRTLFYEAVSKYQQLELNPDPVLDYAAVRSGLYRNGKTIDLLASFEPELHFMIRWLQQLLGESEGKQGKGVFPVVASYSTDLHSLGQMVQEGERNLMETFITVDKPADHLTIAPDDEDIDGLNYLADKTMGEINSRALEGTLEAHVRGGVPCITVSMDTLNAQHLGEFIYLNELFTAVYGYCIGVNPFNQPGVEAYKQAMYQRLGKDN